jgi:hypothetical protein
MCNPAPPSAGPPERLPVRAGMSGRGGPCQSRLVHHYTTPSDTQGHPHGPRAAIPRSLRILSAALSPSTRCSSAHHLPSFPAAQSAVLPATAVDGGGMARREAIYCHQDAAWLAAGIAEQVFLRNSGDTGPVVAIALARCPHFAHHRIISRFSRPPRGGAGTEPPVTWPGALFASHVADDRRTGRPGHMWISQSAGAARISRYAAISTGSGSGRPHFGQVLTPAPYLPAPGARPAAGRSPTTATADGAATPAAVTDRDM